MRSRNGTHGTDFSKVLGSARLHLDEVQQIVDLLDEKCESVEIRAGNRVAEKVDDLRDASWSERKQLKIIGKRPTITVDSVGRFAEGGSVSTWDEDPVARLTVIDVAEHWKSCGSLRARVSVWSGFLLVAALVYLSLVAYVLVDAGYFSFSFSAVALGFLVVAAFHIVVNPRVSIVVPQRRGEGRRLRSQNLGTWIMNALFLVAGLVLGKLWS